VILVTELLLMNFITMLILSSLSITELQQQMNRNQLWHEQQMQTLKAGLFLAYENLKHSNANDLPCFLNEDEKKKDWIYSSTVWWKQRACWNTFNHQRVGYVIDPLAINPCATIENKPIQYYRISVYSPGLALAKEQNATFLLRGVVALPITTSLVCNGEPIPLHHSWQSWSSILLSL
jgi:hypothetical protein